MDLGPIKKTQTVLSFIGMTKNQSEQNKKHNEMQKCGFDIRTNSIHKVEKELMKKG